MTREAKPLWKTSMKMLGKFPECPSDLSEPQLLSLMLENGCMVGSLIYQRAITTLNPIYKGMRSADAQDQLPNAFAMLPEVFSKFVRLGLATTMVNSILTYTFPAL